VLTTTTVSRWDQRSRRLPPSTDGASSWQAVSTARVCCTVGVAIGRSPGHCGYLVGSSCVQFLL
jgi:hypothetical protein